MRALQKQEDGDFEIFGAVDMPHENAISIDRAIEAVFDVKKWPLFGGASGRGWSHFSVAQRCPQLFKKLYDVPVTGLRGVAPMPLEIGTLFHTLTGLYYGAGLGNATLLPERGGLVSEAIKLRGRRTHFQIPPTAADDLLQALKLLCDDSDAPSPNADVVREGERLFDAHTNWWDNREDITPLGIEVFARHEKLGYTCRYDFIGRVGLTDPFLPPGVYAFERKTAKWIDEQYLEAWSLDGEVLGEIMCWNESGMAEMFGPLAGVVLDVVSKGKVPECRRIVLPPTLPAVGKHRKWIQWTMGQIAQWRATGIYPQNFGNCHTRYGRCEEFQNCAMGLTDNE